VPTWISMRSWCTWSALILTSWACALLASADAASAFQSQPPRHVNGQRQGQEMNWGDPSHWDTEQIIAAATSVYAVFTILLWVAILHQTKQLRRSVNLQVNLERPRLITRSVDLVPNSDLTDHYIDIEVKNFGRVSAFVLGTFLEYRVLPVDQELPRKPVYDMKHFKWYHLLHEIPANQLEKFSGDMQLSPNEIADIQTGKAHLWVYGMVDYGEYVTAETLHQCRFCVRWYNDSNRLVDDGKAPPEYRNKPEPRLKWPKH
jgi:hypothetical protein